MFSKIQKKIFYWLSYPTTTLETSRDTIDFRVGLLVGIFITLLIPILNTKLNDAILDHPFMRNIMIVMEFFLFIGSYHYEKIRKYTNEILYALTVFYLLMIEYVLFLKGFTLQGTTSVTLTIFSMGGIFKNKNYLITYYCFISCTFIAFMIICRTTEVDKLYTASMVFINLLLGVYIFGSKINAMKEASESKEWFRNLFNNSPVSIALVGSNIKVFKINEHFQTILGYSENDITLTGLDPIIHPDDRIPNNILHDALFTTPNGTYKTEMRLQTKKGDTLWMRVSMSATHFTSSTLLESKPFVIAVFDDITEKKRADLLLSANAAQLLQQNQALEEFSYVISHDLQEPLRMITSFSQIIQRRYLAKLNNPDIDRDFNFVIDGAKRMSKLIKDMLEYSRWSSQHFPTEKIDTQEVLSEVLQNLTISIAQADAEIVVGEFPNLMANRLVISQVFQNLIGNSINYRHPDRKPNIRVSFTYQSETKNWLCAVRDNGRGFDEKQKERIFGIFQRLHTDKKGTGMGLAICKRIIEKQGGKIWAEGVPDEGATFLFTV